MLGVEQEDDDYRMYAGNERNRFEQSFNQDMRDDGDAT